VDGIPIDNELAPVIRLLWNAGIKTNQCCQEHEPGYCWIQFRSLQDALNFFVPASSLLDDIRWSVDHFHDLGEDYAANPIGCVSVKFPRAQLGTLVGQWRPR
jgi:hypothetical protein